MNLRILSLVLVVLTVCVCADATIISYRLNDLGGGSYEYVYSVGNDSLSENIKQFTIWFDESLYSNLETPIRTAELSWNWDEDILPSTGLGIPLGYDVLTLDDGVGVGLVHGGFSVKFDWLGESLPSSQFYEIIDPVTFQTIDSGFTVPEPITITSLTWIIMAQ